MNRINFKITRNTLYTLVFCIIVQSAIAQNFRPPNYSFEDDTNAIEIVPWNAIGKYELFTSLNANLATDGKYFLALNAEKSNNIIKNGSISQTFHTNNRYKFLSFNSIFGSAVEDEKFGVILKLTKYDPINKINKLICFLDTLIDTVANYRAYRNSWISPKIDIEKYYLNNEIPDSCTLLFYNNINIMHIPSYSQTLFIDNITLVGTSFVSLPLIAPELENLNIYPNPATKNVTLDCSGIVTIQSIEVIDALGRIVLQQHIDTNEIEIDVSCLISGNYSVKLKDKEGVEYFKKLIIE